MALLAATAANLSLRGRLKLAIALQMPERAAADELREIEASREFRILREARVVSLRQFPDMRFGTRRFSGWELRSSGEGLSEALDGRGDLVRLIEGIGQDRFEEFFLRAETLSDEERAQGCGLSVAQARQVRELIDRLYVQAEFDVRNGAEQPEAVLSTVAGVVIENKQPVLAFFNQDVWKGRYEIDPARRAEILDLLSPAEARAAEGLLFRLSLIERRKAVLYLVLEELLATQSAFFVTRDADARIPLTQRELSAKLGIAPSTLNMAITGKAIQLPWGFSAPIRFLLPSSKAVLLGRLSDLAVEHPALTDAALGSELARRFGARLSRRSVAQYRRDLQLGGCGRRLVAA